MIEIKLITQTQFEVSPIPFGDSIDHRFGFIFENDNDPDLIIKVSVLFEIYNRPQKEKMLSRCSTTFKFPEPDLLILKDKGSIKYYSYLAELGLVAYSHATVFTRIRCFSETTNFKDPIIQYQSLSDIKDQIREVDLIL